MSFQKIYIRIIIIAFKNRFEDNNVLNSFKILNPTNIKSEF